MKLAHLLEPLTNDFKVVCDAFNVPLHEAAKPDGKTGLATMYRLLDIVSRNRAYDDAHHGFASGQWKRVLPHDGRDYCFYYAGNANDSHVATLLRAVQGELAKTAEEQAAVDRLFNLPVSAYSANRGPL